MKRMIAFSVASLIAATAWQLLAQEAKPARKPSRGPLPTYYAQLGASDEQKDAMYIIHEEYQTKIDELAAQIKTLQAERNDKLDDKLTPAQKARLKELRDEAEAKKKGPKKAIGKPVPGVKPPVPATTKPADPT